MVFVMLGRVGRRDLVASAILGLAGVGIPLWMAAAAGAIGVPGNDDWVYMRAAGTLFRTGSVDMPGHSAAFIGQLVLVQPLLWLSGGDPWAFTAFGLVMALIGIVSTYLLARRFVGTGSAVMVVLLVLVFPGFARQTASFMTDVPAYAFVVLCLFLGTRWLQGEGGRVTLVASLTAGLVAVSIREFAIAAPTTILVVAWARNRADERAWLAGVSSILAAGLATVLIISASMPGHRAAGALDFWPVSQIGSAFATLAAVLLPAVALGMSRRMATLSPLHVILAAGLVSLVIVVPAEALLGNLWDSYGNGGDGLLSGTRAPVIGAGAWALSGQLAWFAAILVAALVLGWSQATFSRASSLSAATARAIQIARSREAPLLLFLAAYAAELVVYAFVDPLYDRYLYPMVPAAAILLLRGSAEAAHFGRGRAFTHAAFAWLAVSAFVIAANSFAYDAARYRGGEAAVAMGYDARTVDAGYEWVGYHASGPGIPGSSSHALNWYDDYWPSLRLCALLSENPVERSDFRLIRVDRSAYLLYLFFGPAEPLYLYGIVADGCPPPPAAMVAAEAP